MNTETLQILIADRLEFLADRVEFLINQGLMEDARVLRREGLDLATAFDREDNFFVLNLTSNI